MPFLPKFLSRKKKSSSSDLGSLSDRHLTKEPSLDSTISETFSTTPDNASPHEPHFSPKDPSQKDTYPLISTLYKDATDFEKVLYHSGCIDKKRACPKGSTGFADLVAHDLSDVEKANMDRDARICATMKSWTHPHRRASSSSASSADTTQSAVSGDSASTPTVGDKGDGSSDFDSLLSTDDASTFTTTSTNETSFTSVTSDLPDLEVPHIYRASGDAKQALDKLKPEDIIQILEHEFGVLASPEEPEKLLLETDGCLLHGVAVVVRCFLSSSLGYSTDMTFQRG